VRLNSSGYNVARAAGPLVGGLLLGTVGPGWCFVINGASFVAVVAALSGLQLHREAIPDRQRAGLLDSLRSAARNPAARTILVWLALFSAAVAPVQELAAAIAQQHVDGAHGVGALVGALAIGTVAGVWVARALVARAVPRSLQLTLFTLGCALGVFGLAALQPFGATLAMTVVVGLCWCVVYTVALNAVQLILPAELTGRMLGLFQLVTATGLTVGPLVSGVLADALDLELSLAASGVLLGGLAAFGLLRMTHPLDIPARGSDQPARESRGRWATALIHRPLPD
jgi:MFS family permease